MLNKIAIGGDHAGFSYKQHIIDMLKQKGLDFHDFGPFSISSVDYPDFVHPLAKAVVANEYDIGILVCGSGNGVAITANKHAGIRAALCWNEELAALARQHNNANVLCLPARFMDIEEAKKCVETFLNTGFEGGRHAERVRKINNC